MKRVLSGRLDHSIPFHDLAKLLTGLGFRKRQRGSHHIFSKEGVEERINLQRSGSMAKAYQVRQVRKILERHADYE